VRAGLCSSPLGSTPPCSADDYGAAITESRELTDKYTELKRQSLFLRSVRDFVNTEIFEDDANPGLDPDAFLVQLRNPETGARFYIVRQTNSSSTCVTLASRTDW
jgi:hypothetical protein